MLKLCVYIPESHVESVKAALFAAGAGKIGLYSDCCWQVLGEGQFKPRSGSNPYIGELGQVEKVPEYRVELLCPEDRAPAVLEALRDAHPYEEPAYDFTKLWSTD